jgi:enoyl-CoA hydratase/carnithine racemase
MQDDSPIRLDVAAPYARLTLNRPERLNALDAAMWAAMPGLVAQAAADPALKILLVSGADSRAFAAGADISEFSRLVSGGGASEYLDRMAAATEALASFPKPSLAVIQGPCVGGGCGIALCCDFRFADDTARFGVTPARLGLSYTLADTKRLIEAVGAGRAKDLLMTARIVGAPEALSIGLIDRLVPAPDLWAAAEAYAATIAGLSQYSTRAAKAIIAEIQSGATAETEASRGFFIDSFAGVDLAEGARAFMEKRKPRFTFS